MPAPPERQPRPHLHLAFCLIVGLVGWSALLVASYVPALAPPPGPSAGPLAFALFLLVILAARGLAFRPVPERVLSLDTAFFVAASLCLGSLAAGRLVALALTLDSLFRLLGAERARRVPDGGWAEALAHVLYFGGMT